MSIAGGVAQVPVFDHLYRLTDGGPRSRLLTFDVADRIDRWGEEGTYPVVAERARVKANVGFIAESLQQAIDLLMAAHGSGSFADPNPLQRIWRDIHVGTSHAVVSPAVGYETYGKALLGDPTPLSTRQLAEYLAEGLGVRARMWPFPIGILKFGAGIIGRGADAARLVEDLEVRPDWDALGVESTRLRSTRSAMVDVGRSLAAKPARLNPTRRRHPAGA